MPSVSNPVAFCVYLTPDMCSTGEEIVPFDTVYLNHGGGWNPDTYHFVAPVRGLYSFTVSAATCSNARIQLHVMVDGGIHSITRTDNADGSGFQAASTTIMLMLEANQEVWVDTTSGMSLRGDRRSFFTGFLYAEL